MLSSAIQQTTDLMKALELDKLPADRRAEVLAQMGESLLKNIAFRVLEKLPDESIAEFEKIQSSGDFEAMDSFLRAKDKDYEQTVAEAIAEFKKGVMSIAKSLKQSLVASH